MRESAIERHLMRRVREAGGFALKLEPTSAGAPDRLVFLRHQPPLLVELKAPGGRIRPIQVVFHKRLANLGIPVWVLASYEDVDKFVADHV